jgi:hypothetical protein
MAKTQFNVDQLKAEAVKPLYAVAGATEIAYELARGYTAEAQKQAVERFADVQTRVSKIKIERDPKALQGQAVSLVNARIDELQKDAKDAQAKFESRVADLQKDAKAFPTKFQAQVDEAVAELTKTYDELVERGEKVVAAIRKDGVKAVTTVRKAPAKSTVARRQAAKKGAAKKAPASKKPAAKKTAAKKTAGAPTRASGSSVSA